MCGGTILSGNRMYYKILPISYDMVLCRTGKDYLKVLQVNVVGPFLVTLHFLPLLRKKQTRAVVHTSSICGSITGARKGMFGGNIIAYNSSKVP